MKVYTLVVLLATLAVTLGSSEHLRDGRPGCETDLEMRIGLYRNLWDPTAYWKCQTRNQPAVQMRCKEGAFQDRIKKCVNWDDWEWEELEAPPSLAVV